MREIQNSKSLPQPTIRPRLSHIFVLIKMILNQLLSTMRYCPNLADISMEEIAKLYQVII